MAASAVFLVVTLDRFIPGVANGTPLLAIPMPGTGTAITFSIHTLAASATIIIAALIHIRGVGPGRAASNILTTLKIVSLVVFVPRFESEEAQLYVYAGGILAGTIIQVVTPVWWLRGRDGRIRAQAIDRADQVAVEEHVTDHGEVRHRDAPISRRSPCVRPVPSTTRSMATDAFQLPAVLISDARRIGSRLQNKKYRCAIGSTSAGAQVKSSPSAVTS